MIRRRVDGSSSTTRTTTTERMKMLRLRTVRFFGLGFSSRRRKLFYILGTLVLFYLIYYLYLGNSDEDLEEIYALESEVVNMDKWIVLTTIHLPSLTVGALSQLVGWQVLVVGDRKTPKSWRNTNVIFLDVSLQKSLGYRVHQLLPYDSYTRKTIGYLYAIKHGAKYIYDVDDDNFPENGLGGFQVSANTMSHLVLLTNNLTSNPYVHFGQSSLWPRGYPLERIGLVPDRTYDLCETRTPAIQQGVVNGDPDLDAIGRLTRKHPSRKLVLHFDRAAPPYLLPSGTFAPFNSQNTFFRQSAFWAMVLPTMVPDRVSDIFRSYWAQRLMWLIGENLAFAPPNAFQERAGHSDLEDAKDEAGLYHGVGKYIKELTSWKCTTHSFFDCVSELSHDLVAAGLWKSRDAEVVDAWIADLIAVGYQQPDMIPEMSGPCLSSTEPLNVVFYPVEQNTTLPHDTGLHLLPESTNHEVMGETLSSLCGPAFAHHWKSALMNAHKYSDSLLIISVYHNFETIVPLLEAFYKPNYPQILYCTNRKVSRGFMKQWKLSVLPLRETPGAIPCILSAFDMNYNVKGYFHITDSMWMKANHQMTKKHTSLMWLTGEFDAYRPRTLKLCNENVIHCRPMSKDVLLNLVKDLDDMTLLPDKKKTKIRACVAKMERDPTWVAQKELVWVTDLALYLPDRLVPDLRRMREVFTTNQKPFEFMAPLLLECDQLTIEYLEHSEELESISPERKGDYVFPFPFLNVSSGSVSDKEIRKSYCANFEQYG